MDEMPIQCPWEPDGVDFLNVGCKTWTAFTQLPAKIHETDLLHGVPTNVPLRQHFLSILTQQTMFDE
jgi:hypothetical protein